MGAEREAGVQPWLPREWLAALRGSLLQETAARKLGVSRWTLSRWESGEVVDLTADRLSRIADGYGLPLETVYRAERDYVHARQRLEPVDHRFGWDPASALEICRSAAGISTITAKHAAGTGYSLLPHAEQWLQAPVVKELVGDGPWPLDPLMIEQFGMLTGRMRQLLEDFGGSDLLAGARRRFAGLVELIATGQYQTASGRRLYGLAAELAQLIAELAEDTGHDFLAVLYRLAALRCAHVAGDRLSGALVLADLAVAQVQRGEDAHDGLGAAQRAERGLAQVNVPAWVRTRVVSAQAVCAAWLGDALTCELSLNRASTFLAKAEDEPDQRWWHGTPARVVAGELAAESWFRLRRTDEARNALEHALEDLDAGGGADQQKEPANQPRLVRHRGLVLARLALVGLTNPDPDPAAAIAYARQAAVLASMASSVKLWRLLGRVEALLDKDAKGEHRPSEDVTLFRTNYAVMSPFKTASEAG